MFSLILASSLAVAGTLNLTTTSSSGCSAEWYGDCLPNDVWGGTDTFGIDTPGTIPILTMGASSSTPSKIDLGPQALLNTNPALTMSVMGKALTTSTSVGIETRFFNSNGALIATHSDVLHTGVAGIFSISYIKTDIPSNAYGWRSRLVVAGDAAAISAASTGCFSGCRPPNDDPPPDDNGGHGCEECSRSDCPDETVFGMECPPDPCDAVCADGSDTDYQFQSGVNL